MTAQPPAPGTPEEPTGAAPEEPKDAAPEKATGAASGEAKGAAPEEAAKAAPGKAAGAASEGTASAASEETTGAAPEEAPVAAPVGWLPEPAERIFGAGATAEEAYGLLTVDVPATAWTDALTAARDTLGCTYFDWLSAVDEPGTGFRICAHVADVSRAGGVRRLLVRTTVPHEKAALPTAIGVYAGAGWHERETHEMFGVDFTGHPGLEPLLLPEGFEGHPLRKDFVLAARVAKAWPGAKEPGESEHGGPKRRQMLPPGVPDPNEWGPLKGQLPPAPARPARGARGARAAGAGAAGRAGRAAGAGREAAAGAAGERPARRMRSASAGSASQQAAAAAEKPESKGVEPPKDTEAPKAADAAKEAAADPAGTPGTTNAGTPASAPRTAPRSSDAPWHHARPAFEADAAEPEAEAAEPEAQAAEPESEAAKPEAQAAEREPEAGKPAAAPEGAAPEGTTGTTDSKGAEGATRTDDETGDGTA
ncbi:dehydrogenase [Streptomyces sp. Ru73]|uniref:NADH-quinone oxidoreductase subunit C n=1 Tax=Streptomyces sp. Ru73 TaxID=2080748 RepID=UPI000CDDAF16|nr:NADH-quinone oxidoreductase subunit C [Streptomyces sp. Ru73]POX41779.1 dehydrogenase [Streptomyces sp. Ru73]